tara:strand:+ start:1513 stop:1695 length:183 start_codon:yes stop_codon:yes gene_type:complete
VISKEEIKKQIKLAETDIKYIKAYDKNLSEYGKQLLQEKLFILENLKYVESRLNEPCGLR